MPRKKADKGGAIVDDLKTLAVPFAIILAKKGLDMSKKKKSNVTVTSGMSPKSTKKPMSSRRKTTFVGGCSSGCGGHLDIPQGGGSAGGQIKKLHRSIDNFLKKY